MYSIIIKIRPKFIVYSITIKIRLKSIVCSSGSSRHLSVSRDNGVRLGWSSMTLIATAGVAQEPNPGMTVSATVVANEWGRWVGILSLVSSSFFSLPSVCFSSLKSIVYRITMKITQKYSV